MITIKTPKPIKALTKLIYAVCVDEDLGLDGQCTWDIRLDPKRPHHLGWFSDLDGFMVLEDCTLEKLERFVHTRYHRALQFYGTLYIIASPDDPSVHVDGRSNREYKICAEMQGLAKYVKHDSGLWISFNGEDLPDLS